MCFLSLETHRERYGAEQSYTVAVFIINTCLKVMFNKQIGMHNQAVHSRVGWQL